MPSNKTSGILSVLGASIMWALEPIFAKLSFQSTDVFNTFATRILFCLLLITFYTVLKNPQGLKIKIRELKWLIYLSFAATLCADFIYTYALTRVMVINAVLIGHIQPIFIVLLGYFLLRSDRLTKFDYLGISFMIFAGFLVSTKTIDNLINLKFGSFGDLLVLFATFAWATTAITTRKYLKELPAHVIAFYRFLFAGIVFFGYLFVTRGIRITNIYQVLLGFVIGIGTILYYEGLKRIKAAQVAALELSTPFFATLLGLMFLKEFITPLQLFGLFFLALGIFFLSKKEEL
ncbi:MAG: DMT family transporter [candidate division WOR-3 bacterium]|nr:DMT family transporter [candidate division WOR-3 bacterium]